MARAVLPHAALHVMGSSDYLGAGSVGGTSSEAAEGGAGGRRLGGRV